MSETEGKVQLFRKNKNQNKWVFLHIFQKGVGKDTWPRDCPR